MATSFLLLFSFGYAIVKRLTQDAYFRSLGAALLIVLMAGTLFFWLVEGRPFLHAFAFSATTMAMNSPYGIGWGPTSTGGVIFDVIYHYFSVGLFLLFVLETGKTMARSCEETIRKIGERKAAKRDQRSAAAGATDKR